MRLLIITQKVDLQDDVLGFFHGWIAEFSKRFDSVSVICLFEGVHKLPANVKVYSLGKEAGRSRAKYLFRFFSYIWKLRDNYDAVFVHMNPVYAVLGGPFWRLSGKRVSLWYAHGYVPAMLRVAEKTAHVIFTSTKEGCRIVSKKIRIVGQGIDTEKFRPAPQARTAGAGLRIVSIGRISPSKDYGTLIRAVRELPAGTVRGVSIYGSPAMPQDAVYLAEMRKIIQDMKFEKIISFNGPVPNKDIVPFLQSADIFANMGHTGSLDKAPLEAMACGCIVLTCNEAFADMLGGYAKTLMYQKKDFRALAGKINMIVKMPLAERRKMELGLREIITTNHALPKLIEKIFSHLIKKS